MSNVEIMYSISLSAALNHFLSGEGHHEAAETESSIVKLTRNSCRVVIIPVFDLMQHIFKVWSLLPKKEFAI